MFIIKYFNTMNSSIEFIRVTAFFCKLKTRKISHPWENKFVIKSYLPFIYEFIYLHFSSMKTVKTCL